jgi:HK97 gp10 family phage protein
MGYLSKLNNRVLREQMRRELAAGNADMRRQVEKIMREFDKLPKEFSARRKARATTDAAKEFVKSVKSHTPVSEKSHWTYENGKKKKEYKSGNLKESIKILRFPKTKSFRFVGPKINKNEDPSAPDPYYAHMVEYGTINMSPKPFVRTGYITGLPSAKLVLEDRVFKMYKAFEKKIKK